MNLFEIVKYGVSCREAAERYGVEVNHYGMALCPFHNDRHPSLYVADDHYYCFACGEHGDVIDFVSKLFHLSLYDAAQKLAADFHLTPDKPPSAAALHAKRIRTEAQQLRETEQLCFSVLSDYAHVLRDWKVQYAPQSPAEAPDERFVEACHKLDEVEYYLDILASGNSHERAEVIQQQLPDARRMRSPQPDSSGATRYTNGTIIRAQVMHGGCYVWLTCLNCTILSASTISADLMNIIPSHSVIRRQSAATGKKDRAWTCSIPSKKSSAMWTLSQKTWDTLPRA